MQAFSFLGSRVVLKLIYLFMPNIFAIHFIICIRVPQIVAKWKRFCANHFSTAFICIPPSRRRRQWRLDISPPAHCLVVTNRLVMRSFNDRKWHVRLFHGEFNFTRYYSSCLIAVFAPNWPQRPLKWPIGTQFTLVRHNFMFIKRILLIFKFILHYKLTIIYTSDCR